MSTSILGMGTASPEHTMNLEPAVAMSTDLICRLRDTESCVKEDSRDAVAWSIGDAGFDRSLSIGVPQLINEQLRPCLTTWLDSHAHSIESIHSWAVHPGGPGIVEAVDDAIGFDSECLSISRGEHGNMSSPTVFFILERFPRQDVVGLGVMLGFGPGFLSEVDLLQ